MLNPLLIGGISRVPPRPTVALAAAPSSRAVRIHLTVHRCAPFILYFASAKYRLTVTPSNEIKDTSLPPPFPSLSLSLSLSLGLAEETRARGSGEVPATWPTTPLRSLRSRTSYRGFSFYASHFLLSANFVFLSCPSLALFVRAPARGSSASFFLSFPPFLVAPPRDPVTEDYATHNGEI